jgi:hypothetical protein
MYVDRKTETVAYIHVGLIILMLITKRPRIDDREESYVDDRERSYADHEGPRVDQKEIV